MTPVAAISLVVKTFDRSGAGLRNYLGETLSNLERGGLLAARTPWTLTVVDGGSPEGYLEAEIPESFRECVRLVRAARVLTPNENAAASWCEACMDPAADWVLVVEDDIDVCADFLDETAAWLATYARKDRHLYPLGCPPENVRESALNGANAWEYPIGHYWGAQATAARRADGQSLAAYLTAHPLHAGSTQSHDWIIPQWATDTWPTIAHFLTPVPGLVQHIGRQSLLAISRRARYGPTTIGFFEFPSWRGRNG